MKFYLRIVPLLIAMIGALQSCHFEPSTDLTKESIIPKPVSVEASGDGFSLTNTSVIYVEGGNEALLNIGNQLSSELFVTTGFTLKVEATAGTPKEGNL